MINESLTVLQTENGDKYWNKTKQFAKACSWVGGPRLSNLMESYRFKKWEKVFVTVKNDLVIGFSTFTEVDCIPDSPYKPFIGFVFVSESFRSNEIGKKMVDSIALYAKSIGYKKIFVASNEIGLYEKMNFKLIDHLPDYWGNTEQIFVRVLE